VDTILPFFLVAEHGTQRASQKSVEAVTNRKSSRFVLEISGGNSVVDSFAAD
jgi:hypothetical protein